MLKNEELGKAIRSALDKKGVKYVDVAKLFDIKPPSVQNWMRTGRISKDNFEKLQEYLSDTVGPEHWGKKRSVLALEFSMSGSDVVNIPKLDVSGSMGNGLSLPQGYIDVIEVMAVNLEYLRRTVSYTLPSNLAIITGSGDSMAGTFNDGDLLLVDTGVQEIKLDAVYVLGYGDELYIKRIQRRPGGNLLMISDNTNYPPYEIKSEEAGDFKIFGRVLLTWNAKRL